MSKKKFKEVKRNKEKGESKSLRQAVLSFFDQSPGVSFNFKQLARQVGPKNKAVNQQLFEVLEELESAGKLTQLPDGTYASTRKTKTIEGVVDPVTPRFA